MRSGFLLSAIYVRMFGYARRTGHAVSTKLITEPSRICELSKPPNILVIYYSRMTYRRIFQKRPIFTVLLVLLTLVIILSTATLLVNYFRIYVLTSNKENFDTHPLNLTVKLTNTTNGISDPNPNGLYSVTLNDSKATDISLNGTILMPYSDSAKNLTLTIKPKSTNTKEAHYADVFPKQYRLDMTFDASGSLWAVNSASDSTILLKGNTLTINQLGVVTDANDETIAYVKNDTSNQKHWMIITNKQVDLSGIVFNWQPAKSSGTYPITS